MRVLYVTYPWFLDFSIEYIKELSKHVELHVLVVCPENRTSGTIFKLKRKIPFIKNKLYTLGDISDQIQDAPYFEEYIESCASFLFSFSPEKWMSFKNIQYNLALYKYLKRLQIDLIHFDDISIELIWLSFFIRKKKILIDVHDPVAHTGEKNMRRNIIRKCYYGLANGFITYSNFSARIFSENYHKKPSVLSLTPYTFYTKYEQTSEIQREDYILFFGRISAYKGIEKLIFAFRDLKKEFPNMKLLIAGKSVYNYRIPDALHEVEGVIIDDRFIPNDEMANLIRGCRFVVCPYEDASQSGVVMTALAFGKKLVVSKVGGLFEPINYLNGVVYENTNSQHLTQAMKHMLVQLESSLSGDKSVVSYKNTIKYNVVELIKIYERIINVK
ncbi:glycosyltransferase family 4 protein [Sphingobacterium sp. DN00404]|uniref:Glycosyltransferase family 4 protein n=1 Tax=Sphingobacterium micropteri TaxID=2763501 RepID=A0ABR7YKG4_9SPHI|nr:glycosyltransferase family 4 protein [Sphingobacterium micropteri]MBD1431814.1 glycosyltransferase family 4 protein [Sphingobacterium micropteri]